MSGEISTCSYTEAVDVNGSLRAHVQATIDRWAQDLEILTHQVSVSEPRPNNSRGEIRYLRGVCAVHHLDPEDADRWRYLVEEGPELAAPEQNPGMRTLVEQRIDEGWQLIGLSDVREGPHVGLIGVFKRPAE